MCESPSFYLQTIQKARKDYRCLECGGIIRKGERYVSHSGKWDGEICRFRVCVECEELREEIHTATECRSDELIPFGGLRDSIADYSFPEWLDRFNEIRESRGSTDPEKALRGRS